MTKQLKYCPVCAHELIEREGGGRIRQMCDCCGYVHYENPVPGVGILIEHEGGIVLVKRGNPPHKGEWTLPSGFVEADESAEEAAIRETEEETGLKVEIIEMAGINSFPEGPPVSGIMIFFRVRPIGGELCAGDDAADAKVFMPEDLPRLPFRTHREILAQWQALRPGQNMSEPPPTEAFTIRRADPQDEDEILGLLATIPANRGLQAEQWQEIRLRLRESSVIDVYVAQTHQSPTLIIGFISLSVVRGLTEGRGFINDMAVLPSYKRQGVGEALLEAVLRRAGHLNLTSVMVNPLRANDQAQAFYAACGFSDGNILRLKLR